MIGYIKGNVLTASDGVVLIENNGIGYEVICSAGIYQKLVNDKKGEVYTYLSVREDGVSLFGFESLEEKAMFLKLISVSGVGPKMGITVLSGMKLSDLAIKIATSDIKGLSAVKGLGKKTAERIVVELREKIGVELQADKSAPEVDKEFIADADTDDAIIALMSLGFTKTECVNAVKGAKQAGVSGVEKIIAYAIKNIK